MKAIRVHELGPPEVLRHEEVDDASPGPGEALIRVAAAGLNYLDVYYRSGFHWGGHHRRPLPYIPGAEGAGTVVALGEGVTEVAVGDRVAWGVSNGYGAYAGLQAVPVWHLHRLPDAIAFDTAAATMQQGMTAHYLARSAVVLGPGKTVLVHAAAGGTGLLLVQIARMLGARVIGTVSTAQKAERVREAGAHAVIDYARDDFAVETMKLTQGAGVDVVYDSVGKATFERNFDCIAPLGVLVLFGQASGPVPPFDTAILNARGSITLMRPSLTHYVANHHDVSHRAGDLFDWIGAGSLKVTIGQRFALADAVQAHRLLESRHSIGKLLLLN
jgi:NADPH2:quinone reductase